MALGKETEMGLKELFKANAEDYLTLSFLADKLDKLGKKEEAKMLREKARVEYGHAMGIFEKLLANKDVTGLVEDFAKEEDEEHIAEYNNVAMKAKEEGHVDVEKMLCAYAEQEKDIATTSQKVLAMLKDFAKEEDEEHIAEYNNVAMKAKEEGYVDIETMLCAYADQEKGIAETSARVLAMLKDFAKEEDEEHIAEYNNVAMKAKEEGHVDVEKMLCAYAEQEKDIAETTKKVIRNL
ncbi:rubrerythrin [Acidianus manzaensis]|uniref:Rubrerythrin n=1 Tax=Acidianus manzaensis TaxID=282676 RepID=A0A1W6JXM2_9CREN|nr:rubrerythrin [Acidianus manzaensis]ARM74999.1 rubrerythrin [Acidianus manzaensis]